MIGIKQKQVMESNVNVLDVTLRDGGYVNGFKFGTESIKSILLDINKSRIEGIELGFLRDCDYSQEKTLFNKISQAERLVGNNPLSQEYFLMIRPDWYDINKLQKCHGLVRNIRFAFHYRDIELLERQAKRTQDLGYNIFLNPVNITGYDKPSLNIMLEKLITMSPTGISIVDTFGSLGLHELDILVKNFDEILEEETNICFHPHDNLLLSFALTQRFLELVSKSRKTWTDSSLMGMGRAPGNLQTELLIPFLRLEYGKNYDNEYILRAISETILDYKETCRWGYHPAYAMSAFMKVHRSYPEHLMEATSLSLNEIVKVLDLISASPEKDNFDITLASKILDKMEF